MNLPKAQPKPCRPDGRPLFKGRRIEMIKGKMIPETIQSIFTPHQPRDYSEATALHIEFLMEDPNELTQSSPHHSPIC